MTKSKRSRRIKKAGQPDKPQNTIAPLAQIPPRTPSGRLSRPQRRAPEKVYTMHQERCAAIATAMWSPDKPIKPNNPLLHTVLGRMQLAGDIQPRQREAGEKYARLMRDATMLLNSPTMAVGSMDGVRGGLSVEDQERTQAVILAARAATKCALGVAVGKSMDVFEAALDGADPSEPQAVEVAKILTALADHFF